MNRHALGFIGAAAVASLAACKGDPVGALPDEPSRITTTFSFITMNIGDSVLVLAQVRDTAGNPIPATTDVASADVGVAVVSDAEPVPLPQRSFFVRAVAPGLTEVTVSSGAASAEIVVVVFPDNFDGAVSVATTGSLDTIVIASSAQLSFDPAASTISIDGVAAHIVSATDTEIRALAVNAEAVTGGEVEITNVVFLDQFPLGAISAATTVNIRGELNEGAAGNDDPANAPALTLVGTAVTVVDGTMSDTDVDDFYTVTLATPGTITIRVDFDGGGADPDLDAYVTDAAGATSLTGFNAAGAANPEQATTATLAAGTYKVYVNWFDSGEATPPHWYRLSVNRN